MRDLTNEETGHVYGAGGKGRSGGKYDDHGGHTKGHTRDTHAADDNGGQTRTRTRTRG